MFKMMEGHGLGMGGMQGTCGAITGAVAVLGAVNSNGDLEHPVSKTDTYKLSRELVNRFQEKNGVIACKDLKGVETGKVVRSCPGCIEDAATILAENFRRKIRIYWNIKQVCFYSFLFFSVSCAVML